MMKSHSLADDLKPLVDTIRISGHFLPDYFDNEKDRNQVAVRWAYTIVNIILCSLHFIFLVINLITNLGDTSALVGNSLTVLFFLPSMTKVAYFGIKRKHFYRTISIWSSTHTHPLFMESDLLHREMGRLEMRKLLRFVLIFTFVTVFIWSLQPFVVPMTKPISTLIDNTTVGNFSLVEPTLTPLVEVNNFMFNSWYPWDPNSNSFLYFITYLYQVYFLILSICQVNLMDALFSSLLIYACEQLRHLKDGMKSLMAMSAGENGIYPGESFTVSNHSNGEDINEDDPRTTLRRNDRIYPTLPGTLPTTIRPRFSLTPEMFGFRTPAAAIETEQLNIDNPEIMRQDMVVRSAIKYWVERHKHILKFVEAVGETYGTALLLHMLTSTVTLTLLSYEATKISGFNISAFVVVGYLCYTLAQVFLFCVFGNRLIEESISVMHSAYSCPWYNSSEEAKTFVQIVCQQCQRPMSVSGAKFFTVSLDLFASVLGAVVTYFMVLIQLN